jgi:hypothetical protein
VGHHQKLRYGLLLQFCSSGATSSYCHIDSFSPLQRTEGFISEVEMIENRVNSKNKAWLTIKKEEKGSPIVT